MSDGTPAFTENDVAGDFLDAIDVEVVQRIGYSMRPYSWTDNDEDDNEGWPFTVVRDGREFEVDIDVRVTELTPEVKAQRAAEEVRIMAMLKARGIQS
jgi:hypothetical protein